MAELLSAIEENREPSNNGRDNLLSLALAFAATDSSRTGRARPVSVRKLATAIGYRPIREMLSSLSPDVQLQ
jgi:hypothetical protein